MTGVRGCLVLVGTPLGCREDLSPRARREILDADLLLCEDTRSAVRLLGAETPLPPRQSCFAANERRRIPAVLRALEDGQRVVFMSDAGMPIWSDPGRELVQAAIEAGYDIDVIPGPTAMATALCHSGFSAKGARFVGFPPRDGGRRREVLSEVATAQGASVLYESGGRTPALLADLAAVVVDPDLRRAVVARELTKLHQEIRRGSVAELAQWAGQADLRGEITVVVERAELPAVDPAEVAALAVLEALLDPGLRRRERAKRVAELTGLDTNEVYRRLADLGGRGDAPASDERRS